MNEVDRLTCSLLVVRLAAVRFVRASPRSLLPVGEAQRVLAFLLPHVSKSKHHHGQPALSSSEEREHELDNVEGGQ